MLKNEVFWAKAKRGIAAAVFISLFILTFLMTDYLLRPATAERLNVVGIKEEEDLDMVFVGGSSGMVYWQPLRAWNEYGFTSYSLSVSSIQTESTKYHIKQALKYQDPKLFVVDLRAFQLYETAAHEAGIRNSSDSLDIGLDKFMLVDAYSKNHSLEDDLLSYYLDICKYHTALEGLSSPSNWQMILNRGRMPNKGFTWTAKYHYEKTPEDFFTRDRAALPQDESEVLTDLLQYCREKKLQVLFVVPPYVISQEDYAIYNALHDVISEYGFDFYNCNDHFEEMQIDFSTDFYNMNHVNSFGAEKYTRYLGGYIKENYDLPDHRSEEKYAAWDDEYARFSEEEKGVEERTQNAIRGAEAGITMADQLAQTDDFPVWASLADNYRFTIIAVGNTAFSEPTDVLDRKTFLELGLDVPAADNYARFIFESSVVYENRNKEEAEFERPLGYYDVVQPTCRLDNTDSKLSIMIDGEEYSRKDDGINIVVFQNEYLYVVDSVTLKCEDGHIRMIR